MANKLISRVCRMVREGKTLRQVFNYLDGFRPEDWHHACVIRDARRIAREQSRMPTDRAERPTRIWVGISRSTLGGNSARIAIDQHKAADFARRREDKSKAKRDPRSYRWNQRNLMFCRKSRGNTIFYERRALWAMQMAHIDTQETSPIQKEMARRKIRHKPGMGKKGTKPSQAPLK